MNTLSQSHISQLKDNVYEYLSFEKICFKFKFDYFMMFTLCLIHTLGLSIEWNHILLIWRSFPEAVCYKKTFVILNCVVTATRALCDEFFSGIFPQILIDAEHYWCQKAGVSNTWIHTRDHMNLTFTVIVLCLSQLFRC